MKADSTPAYRTPFSNSCYPPVQKKTKADEELFVLKLEKEYVPCAARSDHLILTRKVHIQTGKFGPISDRYSQCRVMPFLH